MTISATTSTTTARLTVAILGASADRAKYGNKSLRAHVDLGYDVYPVNLNEDSIEGLNVYRSLADIPLERLNRISVYLPSDILLGVLPELVEKPCDELFFNPGSEDESVIAKAKLLGLEPLLACSIISLGRTPAHYSQGE